MQMSPKTFSFLEQAVAKWTDRVAIVEENKKTSFKELFISATSLCKLLKDTYDLKGKGIGFMCSNSSGFVSGLFGCSAAEAVVMPILPGTKSLEIENIFRESGINLLLAEKKNHFNFSLHHEKETINDDFYLYIFPEIKSTNIEEIFPGAAFIRPSSGTTGSSKGVVISHQAVFERTEAANDGLHLNEESNMLWVLPMAFHFVVSILLYVRYGVCTIISNHFLATSIIETANKYKASHLYASPLHYRLLASEKSQLKFETLRTAISTSAHLEPNVSKLFFTKYKIPVAQAYGIIEIGLPFINTNPEKQESIGKALPHYSAAILDEGMNELPFKNEGTFAIKGPGMFSGYLWAQRKKEDVLVNSWFLTGDIAKMDEDGFVFIKGRSKSIINVSGNKVFPEEVEAILKLHPDVEDTRVYGGRHPVTGEIVEAEIVLKAGASENAECLISMCGEHLIPYKIPQRILFVTEIAKTKTGKTSRA